MAQIICKNLKVGYEKQVVRDHINFTVEKGDYLCIVGENGSGKSTLMKTLLSLQKPIDGEIIFGDDLHANEIGYLPQQSTVKRDFPATNFEIVLSGCLSSKRHKIFYSKAEKESECPATLNMSGCNNMQIILKQAMEMYIFSKMFLRIPVKQQFFYAERGDK